MYACIVLVSSIGKMEIGKKRERDRRRERERGRQRETERQRERERREERAGWHTFPQFSFFLNAQAEHSITFVRRCT